MNEPIIGIDLGTTFSAVAYVQEGQPTMLSKNKERIMPSIVGFSPAGKLLVGTPAWNQYVLYPKQTVRSIKRKMGANEKVTLGGREYSPAEISAFILRELKHRAEANLGCSVNRAVITVPAYFSDAARQATKDAGEIAGFTVERVINEPTAAALAYGLNRAAEQQTVAVYDLGGGTFDVSIIELDEGVVDVRASHGNTQLGGDDFDQLLADYLAELFEEEHGVDPRKDSRAAARLLRVAEQTKIALSSHPFVRVREEYLSEKNGKPLHLVAEVERYKFESMIEKLIDGTLESFNQAMVDAGISKDELDRVIFVGGSTRIPLIWERVAVYTGLEPMEEVNPDEAVALGASVQGAIIAGKPIEAILVDVTPHSLGIAVARWQFGRMVSDHYRPIVHRNTTLPASRAEVFTALYPDQKGVRVKVYQGENPTASRNTLLGEFLFDDLEQEEPGEPPRVTVHFDLDLNGILHVKTKDRGSSRTHEETMQAAHMRLSVSDKAASARLLEDVEAGFDETLSLLQEAEVVLADAKQQGETGEVLTELQRVYRRLKALSRDPNADEYERGSLAEELLDLLYELEGDFDDDLDDDIDADD
ncbi:MAG: Hsp70 family protein [Anaerolineales bacterium]